MRSWLHPTIRTFRIRRFQLNSKRILGKCGFVLPTMKSANGVLILILGILSIVGFGCLSGLPAWIMGNSALKEIDSGQADPSERGLVQAGRIIGMIMTIITVVLSCLGLAFFFGIFALIGFGASQTPR